MAFVPLAPQQPLSARAQDLGRRLKAEVEKFEAQYPGTSAEDIRAAAGLAIGEAVGPPAGAKRMSRLIKGYSIAVAVLGSMFATAAARGDSLRVLFPGFLALVVGGTVAILAMTLRYRKRSG